jgi:hypothetical protein
LEERLKAIREKEAREKANYEAGNVRNFKKKVYAMAFTLGMQVLMSIEERCRG